MANLFDWKAGKYIAFMGKIAERITPEQGEAMLANPAIIDGMIAAIGVDGPVIVDCDAAPFCPGGWEVVEHREGDSFDLSEVGIDLFVSEKQKTGRVKGEDLRSIIADQPALNANVLDHLLAHPRLIPGGWKDKTVFFWGTIYRSRDGNLYVRCLYRGGGWWNWSYRWLVSDWSSNDPAAVRASSA